MRSLVGGGAFILFDRAKGAVATTAVHGRPLTPELAKDIAGQLGKKSVEP